MNAEAAPASPAAWQQALAQVCATLEAADEAFEPLAPTMLDSLMAALEQAELPEAQVLVQEAHNALAAPSTPRAIEQAAAGLLLLTYYGDALAAGAPRAPLALLPAVNTARRLRGAPPLAPAQLLADEPAREAMAEAAADPAAAARLARKLYPHFLRQLAAALRQPADPAPLAALGELADTLAGADAPAPQQAIWQVATLLLRAPAVDPLQLRPVLARLERTLKALAAGREDPQAHLLWARCAGLALASGTQASLIDAIAELAASVPSLCDAEATRRIAAHMGEAGVAGSDAVLTVVGQELRACREVIDVALRAGSPPESALAPAIESLSRGQAALQILGRQRPARQLATQAAALTRARAQAQTVDDRALATVAEALLAVEQALVEGEGALLREARLAVWQTLCDYVETLTPSDAALPAAATHAAAASLVGAERLAARLTACQHHGAGDATGLARLREETRRCLVAVKAGAGSCDLSADLASASPALPPLAAPAAVDDPSPVLEAEETDAPATASSAGALEPTAADTAAIDPMLRQVFLEEAEDLLAELDRATVAWREGQSEAALADPLLRALHTLKGSARMAEFSQIGNLAHAMEGWLERPLPARQPALLVTALDALHEQVEQLRAGRLLSAPAALLAALDGQAPLSEPDDPPPPDAPVPVAAAADDAASAPTPASEPAAAPGSQAEPDLQPGTAEIVTTEPLRPFAGAPRNAPRYRLAPEAPAASREAVRVDAEHLDTLLDHAGEISLHHARLERQLAELDEQLREFHESVGRLQRQVRALELETDTRIAAGEASGASAADGVGRALAPDFDALELDRYTPLQQIARGLAENTGDLGNLHGYMEQTRRETQSLLLQQSRLSAALQQTVLQTRMIAMSHYQPRLERVVRQTAHTLGKAAELQCSGLEVELDRRVAEIIVGPVEHLLRNALAHGIEPAARRRERGKPETGVLTLAVQREGREIVLSVGDDGNGLDLAAIRTRAQALGLWDGRAPQDEQALTALILRPHFSTAAEVSQVAGRGVGLDAVDAAVRQLGGSISLDHRPGAGMRFTLRLPTTLALSRVLLVRLGEERLALPLRSIGDVQALTAEQSEAYLRGEYPTLTHGPRHYALRDLAALTDSPQRPAPRRQIGLPVVLVEVAGRPFGLVVDQVLGSQEVVVKALGPQAGALPGLIGATVLDDGEAVLIADPASLLARAEAAAAGPVAQAALARPQILVVDDSLTVRRVTSRLLAQEAMDVATARDGVEALGLLRETPFNLLLLDIEMPRMDGFELARHVRRDPVLKAMPIVMISSRTGTKHREQARALGVAAFLGKPYQSRDLVECVRGLLPAVDGDADAD